MMFVEGPFEEVPGVPPKRLVRVYVPQRAPAEDRPFLLLFDGQNVFDDEPSFAGGWHAQVAVERLAKSVPAPVIVGLNHGYEHRISELSPFPVEGREGRLEQHLGWIASWLLPQLREKYRLTRDPRRSVVGGSSMGGLASLYSALRRPDVFGGALVMSPSLWVGRGALFDWLARNVVPQGSRLYLDAGSREAGGRVAESTERMAQMIASHHRAEVYFREDKRGQHRESDWRRRLLPALRFHFGKSKTTKHTTTTRSTKRTR